MDKLLLFGEAHSSPNMKKIGAVLANRLNGKPALVLAEGPFFTKKEQDFRSGLEAEITRPSHFLEIVLRSQDAICSVPGLQQKYLDDRGLMALAGKIDVKPIESCTLRHAISILGGPEEGIANKVQTTSFFSDLFSQIIKTWNSIGYRTNKISQFELEIMDNAQKAFSKLVRSLKEQSASALSEDLSSIFLKMIYVDLIVKTQALRSFIQAEYLLHWLSDAASNSYGTIVSITGGAHVSGMLSHLSEFGNGLFKTVDTEVFLTEHNEAISSQIEKTGVRVSLL